MSDPRDEPEAKAFQREADADDAKMIIFSLRQQLADLKFYYKSVEAERDILVRQNDRLRAAGKEV